MDEPHANLHQRILNAVQRELELTRSAAENVEGQLAPAWLRVTQGEPRWPVSVALAIAITMQFLLPDRQIIGPRWFLTSISLALLVALVAANPRHIDKVSPILRKGSLVLIGIITIANAWSATKLIDALIRGTAGDNPLPLLLNGAGIWVTNVIAFALWYWEFDRGGPGARAQGIDPYPDFLFPQMQTPDIVPPNWEPGFVDYLYLSYTNATAFSPTDVLPISRWAKLTMMLQSAVSLTTVALVIARAVNILK